MMMLSFHPQAWDDYLYWQQTDKAVLKRVNLLIKDIHRVVYKVDGDEIIIAQLRGHYD